MVINGTRDEKLRGNHIMYSLSANEVQGRRMSEE